MTHIGKNIRKIRTLKKLSQAAFADLFGIKRANIGAYEEGRAQPKMELVMQIANEFSVSVDALLTREITVNELASFTPFNDPEVTGLNAPAVVTDSRPALHHIPIVMHHVANDYLRQSGDLDFLNGLPLLALPPTLLTASRAFEIRGSELQRGTSGIRHGDLVFGETIPTDEWRAQPTGFLYIWVLSKRITVRRLITKGKKHYLAPDNPDYPPTALDWNEVREMLRVTGALTANPEPLSSMEDRMHRLEQRIEELQARLIAKGAQE